VTTGWVIRKTSELQVLEVGQAGQADMEWRAWLRRAIEACHSSHLNETLSD